MTYNQFIKKIKQNLSEKDLDKEMIFLCKDCNKYIEINSIESIRETIETDSGKKIISGHIIITNKNI